LLVFIWIPVDDGDLCFSLMLARKANDVEEETMWNVWLNFHHNQSLHVTDIVTVMSLSASLLQKVSAATDHLCQITLNRKLLHKFGKWCTSSSCIKAKSCKKKSHKM